MTAAISDLDVLLGSMEPALHDGTFAYCVVPHGTDIAGLSPVATVVEAEGLTLVLPEPQAREAGLEVRFRAARITLTVHSDLQAVGLTAAFAAALGRAGVSCNVVAGVYHDHLFVPVEQARLAMSTLQALQRESAARPTVAIRPATPAHAPDIHALQRRAFAEEGRLSGTREIPPLTEPVDAIEAHIRTQTVLLACQGERVVGAARGIVDGAVCTLRGVIVEPDCHGQGIGSRLLRAVEAAHPQVARFELITNTLVPGNVRFYEQRGYRVDALIPHGETIVLARMSKAGNAGPA